MTEDGIALVVCGTAMHTPALGAVDILEDVLIVVDDDGTIARIDRSGDPNYDRQKDQARDDGTLTVLGPGRYLLPGLVDLHIHAPQWQAAV